MMGGQGLIREASAVPGRFQRSGSPRGFSAGSADVQRPRRQLVGGRCEAAAQRRSFRWRQNVLTCTVACRWP